MHNKTRKHKMRGGEGDWYSSAKDSFTNLGSNLSSQFSSMWNKTKESMGASTSTPYTPSTVTQVDTPTTVIGGKTKRRHRRHRRHKKIGGTPGYTPSVGIASTGTPFTGHTAEPHNWVGGKRRMIRKTSKK
jgi:hypothetical protein